MSEAKKLQESGENKKKNRLRRILDLTLGSRNSAVDWIVLNSSLPSGCRTDHGFMVDRMYNIAP